jgi:hypothetical protein
MNVAEPMTSGSDRVPQSASRVTLTPAQLRNRRRVETVIGLAAPVLDLVLAVGDRISRLAEPRDYEYYPVRAGELREQPPAPAPERSPSGD